MRSVLPYIIVGITTGSIYALAAVGLVLTFRTSGIFNFAHGAQAALAAYVMFEFRQRMGLPWPVAGLLSLLLAGVATGLVLERLARVLATAPVAARVTATIGLFVGIQGAIVAIFGGAAFPMKFFLPTRLFEIGGVTIRYEQVIVTSAVLLAVVGLTWFLGRSRTGAATQAVVDDPALLALQGTNPAAVRRTAWVIGSCFAAVSGMLLAPTTGLDVYVLSLLVFFAFGAAAVGAFNSLGWTYAGGLGIGVAASLLTKYVNASSPLGQLPSTLPFLVLFGALLLTPRSRLIERGEQTVRRALPPVKLPPVALVATAALLLSPPLIGVNVTLYTTALAFVILFASLSLLVRTSAQISLCQMTFAAVGGAACAHAANAGIPWPLAVALGGLVAVPVGALVAIPAIRLSGLYLAIATFGLAVLVQRLFFTTSFLFGSGYSVLRAPRPKLGWLEIHSDAGYYYVVLTVTVLACAMIMIVRRSRLGRLLQGLADAPVALSAHGTNTNVTRLWVFCLTAFLAGVAGAILAPITGSASPPLYDFSVSLLLVAVLFIAGRQPILGPFIAAVLFIVIPGSIRNATVNEYTPVLFGVGAVVAAMAGGYPVVGWLRRSRRVSERAARPRTGRLAARMGAIRLPAKASG